MTSLHRLKTAGLLCLLLSTPLSYAQQQALDWGNWNKPITEIDLDALPLSALQKDKLYQQIRKLRDSHGVGILGELEQAINNLDKSSLHEDKSSVEKKPEPNANEPFLNDIDLERQILSLEFASKSKPDDPEGLLENIHGDEQLFNLLMQKLTDLENQDASDK